MNALKIALFSATAIAFAAPAFAQTADTSKPAVTAPSAAPSDTAKPAAKSDAKTETKADASTSGAKDSTATHKGKKHHKHASASPAKSTAPATGSAKSSS